MQNTFDQITEFNKEIKRMAHYYNRSLTQDQIDMYWDDLAGYPIDVVVKALNEVRKHVDNMPKSGAIIKVIQSISPNRTTTNDGPMYFPGRHATEAISLFFKRFMIACRPNFDGFMSKSRITAFQHDELPEIMRLTAEAERLDQAEKYAKQ